MGKQVKALIITGFALNCEAETTVAFRTCGATADQLHLNDLAADRARLADYHILAFIGGFSFGDHLGAGTVFASRVRHHLGKELKRFIADGKLIVGICNGFQTMARLGLVPALDGAYFKVQAALAQNAQNVFRDAWITVRANPRSPCVFTRGLDRLPLPVRHGEGQFVMASAARLKKLEAANQVVLHYVDPATGAPTDAFPHNPNGSTHAIAGVCDPTGRIFGLMPHPEAYLSPYNHPHWQRQQLDGTLPAHGLGRQFFLNAVDCARAELA